MSSERNYNDHESHFTEGILSGELYTLEGKMHRLDGPAYISYKSSGKKWMECYLKYGKYIRDGPHFILYFDNENNSKELEQYIDSQPEYILYYQNGNKLRELYTKRGEEKVVEYNEDGSLKT